MSEDQELRNFAFRERKHLIGQFIFDYHHVLYYGDVSNLPM